MDLIIYSERITYRRLSDYIMQSNIAVLPYRSENEAQAFLDSLHDARSRANNEDPYEAHLDEGSLMALKERLASESKAIAVK